MGEVAEDMVDGTRCALCGMFFKEPGEEALFTHGYPAVCEDCWETLTADEKESGAYQEALADTW